MSEENVNIASDENAVNNPSTEAVEKNVPYDRFQKVNADKNDSLLREGKLQAQIDKMNQSSKQQQEAKLEEALDIVTKERDTYKIGHDENIQFKTDRREMLMSKLTNDEDKSIADGLQDMIKLENFVNKVVTVSAPSTSSARATTAKAGDLGGYNSYAEWATKDPKGYEEAHKNTGSSNGIKVGFGDY